MSEVQQTQLIDIQASIASGTITYLSRPEKVAASMLLRKPYRGQGHGRYILASEKEKYFGNTEDEALKGVEEPSPAGDMDTAAAEEAAAAKAAEEAKAETPAAPPAKPKKSAKK